MPQYTSVNNHRYKGSFDLDRIDKWRIAGEEQNDGARNSFQWSIILFAEEPGQSGKICVLCGGSMCFRYRLPIDSDLKAERLSIVSSIQS